MDDFGIGLKKPEENVFGSKYCQTRNIKNLNHRQAFINDSEHFICDKV